MKRWPLLLLLACACDRSAGEASPKNSPAAERPEPEAKAEVAENAPVAPIEAEWIVWFDAGQGVQSRWYTKTGEGVSLTASRKALAVGAGASLWVVRRADGAVDVFDCACVESERDPLCRKTGEVQTLGLEALPMGGGPAVALEPASSEAIYGEVDALALHLRGGVGPRLFVETADSGYYCGAHGSYGGAAHLRDVQAKVQPAWPELTLPNVMLREAAVSGGMLEDYKECWDRPELTLGAFVEDTMTVASVELSLDAGMLKLTWNTEADGPYVCTGDYAFHGRVSTGLMSSAKSLGLAPPLPDGLQEAFSDIGTATVVGWSPVTLEGTARDEALAWFRGLDETAWPPASVEQTTVAADVSEADVLARRKLLDRGRTLTKDGDYAGAVTVLSEAIDADPTAARPLAARCYAHLLAGSLADARTDCEKALTLHPGDRFAASVHYNLGKVAEGEGKPQQARKAYETSLELRENATVRKALEAL